MHKAEIKKLHTKVTQKGITLIPLRLYFKGSLVKVELGLCRGKHTYDKREALKQKDIKKAVDRQSNEY